MANRDLGVRLTAENKASAVIKKFGNDIETTTQRASKNVTGLAGSFGDLFKRMGGLKGLVGALGIGYGISELVSFGRESIALAQEQARVEKQLDTVLQSTGHAAGLTAKEVKGLASELQGLTNYGDEATLRGQNLLLTFTNIGQTVFPQATRTMLDMSAALGQDLKSSALQLGKALNDPVKGVTALQEVGVSFSAQQRETIKTLAETGQVAEAQTLILEELNREFGGSAEAAREADGGFIALGNSIGDLQEAIGAGGVAGLSGFVGALRETVDETTASVNALREASGQASLLGQAFTEATGTTEGAAGAFAFLTDTAKELVVTSNPLLNAFVTLKENTGTIERGLTAAAHAIIENTSGWDKLAKAYGNVSAKQPPIPGQIDNIAEAAGNAAEDLRDYASAANEASRALGLMAIAEDQAESQRRGAETQRYAGLAGGYRTNPVLVAEKRELEDIRVISLENEQARISAAENEASAIEEGQRRARSAYDETQRSIESAISSAVSQADTLGEVFDLSKLTGGGEGQNADETARRLASLFEGGGAGVASAAAEGWLEDMKADLAGFDFTGPLLEAINSGDSGAVSSEAGAILGNAGLRFQLIDKEAILAQARQQIQEDQIREALIAELSAELGADQVAVSFDPVRTAAGEVTTAQGEVEAGAARAGDAALAMAENVGESAKKWEEPLARLLEVLLGIAAASGQAAGNLDYMAGAGARAGLPTGAASPGQENAIGGHAGL